MFILLVSALILALPFTAEGCGKTSYPPSSWRVVGGAKAAHGSWPWQISVRLVTGGSVNRHVCGGTIISDRWVLTAAHCFFGTKTISEKREHRYYQVRVGEHRQKLKDGTERDIEVEKIIRHPEYTGKKSWHEHDIALLKLSDRLAFSDYVQPVCLNDAYGQFDNMDGCWITGWGSTLGTEDRNHLQQLQGRVWTNQDCQRGWDNESGWGSDIKSGMVCFGHGDRGACVGDSGGPLVCRKTGTDEYTQVGVTSWGHEDCDVYGKPNVYTRVASYYAWINNTIASYSR